MCVVGDETFCAMTILMMCDFVFLFLFLVPGIPLSYFVLLYTRKDKKGSEAFETDVVYMLCEDYTSKCW
jgi:hypothetical protein